MVFPTQVATPAHKSQTLARKSQHPAVDDLY